MPRKANMIRGETCFCKVPETPADCAVMARKMGYKKTPGFTRGSLQTTSAILSFS